MINEIIASKHPPEYLLHKYWARKPHNVLREIIKFISKNQKLVLLDPFCGSGVFLREGSLLGHECYGFDVNPISSILSDITCNPPNLEKFIDEIDPIIEDFRKETENFFRTTNGELIKYYVHEIIVSCSKCNYIQSSDLSINKGNKFFCKKCKSKLSFSLKNLHDTKITEIHSDKGIITKSKEINSAKKIENVKNKFTKNPYNFKFVNNDRILAFKGMETKNLFTCRNFYLLTYLANKIYKIKNDAIRKACLLLLTGSVAQCSRLIPYRNNLKTGGPAWSVPGFWVPKKHLETNPYIHLKARYKKFIKGLEVLNKFKSLPVKIYNLDNSKVNLKIKKKVDLIFLDPPYGDSIPYLEFSSMWNSFLKKKIDPELDISVSDRNNEKNKSWERYYISLSKKIKIFSKMMSRNGKILITFNNNDIKAWEALLSSLQTNNFVCIHSMYQSPPVISSKSQFARENSYISDIYSIFIFKKNAKYSKSFLKVNKDLESLEKKNKQSLTKSEILRNTYLSFLKHNLDYTLLKNIKSLTKNVKVTKKVNGGIKQQLTFDY